MLFIGFRRAAPGFGMRTEVLRLASTPRGHNGTRKIGVPAQVLKPVPPFRADKGAQKKRHLCKQSKA